MNITYKLNPISKSFTSKNKAEMFWDEKTVHLHARSFILMLWLCVLLCSSVDQELGFYDKYLFYRFLDDEEEDTPLPSEEEKRESEEELPETILFLAQIGPDALLRMILRKSSVLSFTLEIQIQNTLKATISGNILLLFIQ